MIYKYIINNFLKKLLYLTMSMSFLIILINLFTISYDNAGFLKIIQLVLFKTPIFIEEIFMFIVMLAAIISFQDMLIHNELTIIRVSGFSIIKIISPICISAFIIGILFILIISPLSVMLDKKARIIEKNIDENSQANYISNVWLKEKINNSDENRIYHIKSLNIDNYQMKDVSIWVFGANNIFVKRINAQFAKISNNNFILKDVKINSKNNINKIIAKIDIVTNINHKIIDQYQKNNEKKPREIIYNIPKLANSLNAAGISAEEINLYFHSLLNKPFLLFIVCIIAAVFGINHSARNKKNVAYVILGILSGLFLHITIEIINSFAASGMLEIFIATWFISIILFFLSSSMILKKEI